MATVRIGIYNIKIRGFPFFFLVAAAGISLWAMAINFVKDRTIYEIYNRTAVMQRLIAAKLLRG
jgi:hypothetical protein